MPGHADTLFQTTLEPAEKWHERRQFAETLEQRTSTEMEFDDDEIGVLLVRRHAAVATAVAGTFPRRRVAVERRCQLTRQGALADLRGPRDEVRMRQCPGRHGAL